MADITIPPEAVKAVARLLDPDVWVSYYGKPREFKSKVDAQRIASMCRARAVCLAILKNWPGRHQLAKNNSTTIREMACFILPLTTENTDD